MSEESVKMLHECGIKAPFTGCWPLLSAGRFSLWIRPQGSTWGFLLIAENLAVISVCCCFEARLSHSCFHRGGYVVTAVKCLACPAFFSVFFCRIIQKTTTWTSMEPGGTMVNQAKEETSLTQLIRVVVVVSTKVTQIILTM